ncbi:MAG TPA: hypothetical protein VEB21_13330 [Terriglobales bacterium]|nr:hypothetical protein [Terriglobales bacterium]
MEAIEDAQRVRELIARCLDGDAEASRQFQQTYGELIYGYPIRVFRIRPEDAGDFYVFAFHGGRIYRRVRTFEGRAPFRAYLLGFVLDDLILEWKRAERTLDTIPLEEVSEMSLQEAAGNHMNDDAGSHAIDSGELGDLLSQLDVGKVVVLKLLHAEDYELTPAEIRHIATISKRPIADVIAAVDNLRLTIRDRESALRAVEDGLESVQAWIQLYQKRLARITDDLQSLPPGATAASRLRQEQAEVERKIKRREQQRTKLQMQARRRKVTAPYKDLAAILNTTIGNIGSQISRLREELTRLSAGQPPAEGDLESEKNHGPH